MLAVFATMRFRARPCNGLVGINSEVSYQLDHAPEDRQNNIGLKHLPDIHTIDLCVV
jgi:hypothetical protein